MKWLKQKLYRLGMFLVIKTDPGQAEWELQNVNGVYPLHTISVEQIQNHIEIMREHDREYLAGVTRDHIDLAVQRVSGNWYFDGIDEEATDEAIAAIREYLGIED